MSTTTVERWLCEFMRRASRPIMAGFVLFCATAARGDVSPPVSIKMSPDRAQAVSGEMYSGEFLVTVHEQGTLTDFRLAGDGWAILSFDPPATPMRAEPGTIRIPFRATPTDADKSIGLQVKFNGRKAQHGYHVGPAAFSKKGKPGHLTAVAGATPGPTPALQRTAGGAAGPFDLSDEPSAPSPRGGTIVVEGRIVYDRPGADRSDPPDGDFDDTDDIPPATVGADGIAVYVLDNDPVDYEVMWSGFTDEHGRFVTPPLDADMDAIDPAPDLILRVVALREDWGGVFSEDADWFYTWDSEEILNCEEAHFNFGTRAPLDPAQHPAVHVYNTIIRARRFILENPNIATRFVTVLWPADHWSEYHADDDEIHLLDSHGWQESTIIHEYGHHFLNGLYETPPPDYCNGFCDGTGNCDFDQNCPDQGHCGWCRETDHDAWNEGWPNWLADLVTRNLPERYTLDVGGPPCKALFLLDGEWPGLCCVDMTLHDADAVRTEGFVHALLRDIDDATLEDHDDNPGGTPSFDGIRDLMCIGPNHIFQAVVNHHPITVLDFLNGLRADWPQFTPNLRATAFNVGGAAYIAGFPSSDSQGPGPVLACDSPSHPLGGGGALPCMIIAWTPAADDASGAVAYSYELTHDPAGVEPDESPNTVFSTETCQLAARFTRGVGEYYFSIKAQDGLGNWSNEWRTFGPFTVTDCNGSGLLDLCDIDCPSDGVPGVCEPAGLCLFGPGVDCGLSSDCNVNYIPDECDIASGQSDDCNQNGIPDECETSTLKHWTGNDGTNPTWWHLGTNWAEGAAPAAGNDVCIAAGEPSPLVRRDPWTLGTLACDQNLSIATAAGFPGAALTLQRPSFILGNLSMSSGALQVNDALRVDGTFNWSGGTLRGVGQTTVTGSCTMSTSGTDMLDSTLNLQCNTTASNGIQGNNFTIHNFAGRTYNHNGTGVTVADGNAASQFINEGTFRKSGGAGSLRFGLRVNNSGLIRAETGTLSLRNLTCTGDVLGLPGTTLEFAGTADFEPGSSVVGDLIWPRTSATTVNIRGTYQAANTTVGTSGEFPTLNFLPGANIVDYGDNFIIALGTANFRTVHGAPIQLNNVSVNGVADFDSGDPVVIQTLTLGPSTGTLRGDSQQFTINGLFRWRQVGNIVDPGEVHANGGIIIEASSSQRDTARVLYNAATATFLGAIGTASTGRFHNLPTGTALLQGDSTGVTGGRVTNEGTVVKTTGTGRSTLTQLTNSGLVHAQTGEIYFYFGGTNNGEIRGDPGTLLTLGNAHEMSPTSILTADDITFTGQGNTNIRGAVSIADTITSDGGVVVFTNEADVASYGQNLNLLSGTVQFQSPTASPTLAFDTVSISGNVHFVTGQPVSVNALTLTTGTINGPSPITVNNAFTFRSGTILAGGLMTANGPVSINSNGNTRNLHRNFDNTAMLTFVNGGLQLANATLTNLASGTIDIQTTGAAFGLTTTATLQNNGLLLKSAGAGTSTIGNHFRNAGTVDVQTGVLQFTGTNGLTHIQTAGQTILNGGGLAITSTAAYQIQGGDLKGNGTVTGNVSNSGGAVKPGLSAGTLTITGAYTQQAGGAYHVELGGVAPGQFDVVNISGAATINGELNVQTINGFTPATGNTFVVLTAGSINGTFGSLTGSPGFSVSYTPTQVFLTATTPQLPGDLDGDCDVDLQDLAFLLSNFGTTSGATYAMGDIDGDEDVDLQDLAYLLGSFGSGC